MDGQPALNESDLAVYQKYAGDIAAMEADTGRIMGHVLASSGWTEARLTYVAVKVGLSLTRLEDPNSPWLAQAPDFAWPTGEEQALIDRNLNALVKALMTAKPTAPAEEEVAAEPAAE
jgi:hypothetical protein